MNVCYLDFLPLIIYILQPREEKSTIVSATNISILLLLVRINGSVNLLVPEDGAHAVGQGLVGEGPRGAAVHAEDLLLHGQHQLLLLHQVLHPQLVALVLLAEEQVPQRALQRRRQRDLRNGPDALVLALLPSRWQVF